MVCGRCGGGLRLFESVRLLLWAWVCDGCRLWFEPVALVDDGRWFVEEWWEWERRPPRPGRPGRRVSGRARV